MKMKKLAAAVGLGLSLSLIASASQAALWSFEDDDIDFILDPDTLTAKTSGALEVNDIFVSVFEIPVYTRDGVNGIPEGQELTGVAAVELVGIFDPAGNPINPDQTGVGSQYLFEAYTGGLNAILGLGGDASVDDGDAGEGAAIAMWFNGAPGEDADDRDLDLNRTTNPATNCTSLSDCIEQASLGELFQVDGFGLDPDEIWASTQILAGGNDIGTVLATGNSTLISAFNMKLSNLYQAGGYEIGFLDIQTELSCGNPGYIADGCVQLSGSGTITGGQGLLNGAIAHSDFDAQKIAVPEPGLLALIGMGLVGFGARHLKRKS